MQWANKHLKRGEKVTKGTRPGPRKCKSKKALQLSQRQEARPSPSGQICKTSRVVFLKYRAKKALRIVASWSPIATTQWHQLPKE